MTNCNSAPWPWPTIDESQGFYSLLDSRKVLVTEFRVPPAMRIESIEHPTLWAAQLYVSSKNPLAQYAPQHLRESLRYPVTASTRERLETRVKELSHRSRSFGMELVRLSFLEAQARSRDDIDEYLDWAAEAQRSN